MSTVTMLHLLLAILRKDRESVPRFQANISLDGCPIIKGEHLLVMTSTLERLFLGMRPFWGKEVGALHYTALATEPKCILRVILSLFLSRMRHHATPANGFFSHNVDHVQLEMEGDFTLDGELYSAGEGLVTITPAGPINFLCSR